jgi:hypothetical protein
MYKAPACVRGDIHIEEGLFRYRQGRLVRTLAFIEIEYPVPQENGVWVYLFYLNGSSNTQMAIVVSALLILPSALICLFLVSLAQCCVVERDTRT